MAKRFSRMTGMALAALVLTGASSGIAQTQSAATPDTTTLATVRSEPTETDRRAIERVIRAQLAAFQDDDAAGAFAYAAPAVRARYGSADVFLHAVRHGYAPLYRLSQAVFGPLVMSPHGPVQKVKVVAADGRPFTAMYWMQRQSDRTWAIAGVLLTAVGDREA